MCELGKEQVGKTRKWLTAEIEIMVRLKTKSRETKIQYTVKEQTQNTNNDTYTTNKKDKVKKLINYKNININKTNRDYNSVTRSFFYFNLSRRQMEIIHENVVFIMVLNIQLNKIWLKIRDLSLIKIFQLRRKICSCLNPEVWNVGWYEEVEYGHESWWINLESLKVWSQEKQTNHRQLSNRLSLNNNSIH